MTMSKQVRVDLHLRGSNRAYSSACDLEFKRHQKVDNPVHIIGFLSQWKLYLDHLEEQTSSNGPERFRGHKMDPTVFEKVRWQSTRRIRAYMLC